MNARLSILVVVFALGGCDQSGRETAHIVQAATHGAAEIGTQLTEKVFELTNTTPEQAKAKLQEVFDLAAQGFKDVKDSEAVQKIAIEVERALAEIGRQGVKLGQKLHLAELQKNVEDLITRFQNDPRVVSTLKSLQEKLQSLAR